MNKLKQGLEYEIYCLSVIKEKYKNCWLWKDIPKDILINHNFISCENENCDDIGCDILAQKHDLSFDYIQCKNYTTTSIDNTINIYDLSGFYNFIAENNLINGIVYYSGKLSSQIITRNKKIKYINLPYFKIDNVEDFIPRDYQIEAYNKLKNENRSILSMACGTGKTFVSYLLSKEYDNIILLTPLISTTEQILKHFKTYNNKNEINYIEINSSAGRSISKYNFSDKNIIATTYDSVDIVNKILEKKLIENPFIIIDEFHNLSENNLKSDKSEIKKLFDKNFKMLFVSATPKIYENYNYGNIKYELSLNDAIKNKYICDYNFYYPNIEIINQKYNESIIDLNILENKKLFAKAYFILNGLQETKSKKCIIYLKTVEESNKFKNILTFTNTLFNLKLNINNIDYTTTKNKRIKILNNFENNDSNINILCNVHVLDEGIDIPKCDSVYLTNPNNNFQNIIQRISRCNRKDKNNYDKIARVFIWSKDTFKINNINDEINKYVTVKIDYKSSNINYKITDVNLKNNSDNDIDKTKYAIYKDILKYNDNNNITVVYDEKNKKPYFFAKHVCLMLEYKDTKDAIRMHIDKKNIFYLKDIITNKNLDKKMSEQCKFIDETGFFNLILKCKTNKGKELNKWLTTEILPFHK